MLFNSLSYIVFLWAVFVAFWTLRPYPRARQVLLLAASYWFYGRAHWAWAGLLAASTLTDYVAGAAIQSARDAGDRRRADLWLALSLVVNLGILGTFKYFDFFSGALEEALRSLGVDARTWRLDLVLPVGISFYTFQTLSYTLDIHAGRMRPTDDPVGFALYVAFFPQLVAGPIVRAIDFLPQLRAPTSPTATRVAEGVFLIMQGLAKKLIVADLLGSFVIDPCFARPDLAASVGAPGVLLLGFGFMLQVYGDFGGYSDIAIGSARILGFELRPNFAMPLAATSLDEFWRRWHISMTTWFRDYVFVPLGGSRSGRPRVCVNVLVTMIAVGLWHGATWNYVAFGVVHGVALIGVHLYRARSSGVALKRRLGWRLASWIVTMVFLSVTILFYRAPDLRLFVDLVGRLGDWSTVGVDVPWQVGTIALAAFVAQLVPQARCDALASGWARWPAPARALTIVAVALVLFGLRPPGEVPFYYFQF